LQGKGREFVSIYIPFETSIDQSVAFLKKNSEKINVGSERLNDRFQATLKGTIQYLKQQQKTPENGLAVFAGTRVAEGEKEALTVETIIPSEPLTAYQFRVDDHFHLDPLREMLRNQKIVGILTLDAKEASFGVLTGERLEVVESISSGVPGKTGKGGQSQRRYERERDMELTAFFHRVAEHAVKDFLEKQVNVLLAGGPGQTKNDFLKSDFLHYELSNMLLNTVDTQSVGEAGIREVICKSEELLKKMCGPEERKIMQRLFSELRKPGGLATYGLDSVIDALNQAAVQVIIVADNTDMAEIFAVCKKCGTPKKELSARKTETAKEMMATPCQKCGATSYEMREKDIVDVLEDLAVQTNASVEVVSSPSPEKDTLNSLGGLAALLRFRTNQ
jgi:peptide chain release factor subunit 1